MTKCGSSKSVDSSSSAAGEAGGVKTPGAGVGPPKDAGVRQRTDETVPCRTMSLSEKRSTTSSRTKSAKSEVEGA
jgi:hypothetical protein